MQCYRCRAAPTETVGVLARSTPTNNDVLVREVASPSSARTVHPRGPGRRGRIPGRWPDVRPVELVLRDTVRHPGFGGGSVIPRAAATRGRFIQLSRCRCSQWECARREPEPVDPITVHGRPGQSRVRTRRTGRTYLQPVLHQPTDTLSVHGGPGHYDTGCARIQVSGPPCLTASPRAGSDPHHRRRHVVHTKPIPLQAIPATRSREHPISTDSTGWPRAARR